MTTLLGIQFDFMGMVYYHTTKDISIGDTVIVTTPHGTFPGKVTKTKVTTEEESTRENFSTLYPAIERIATFSDMSFYRTSLLQAEKISKSTQEIADRLQLNMKVLQSYLDISEDKVLITFTSDARVDFRELIRLLGATYHLKIELRQIGPRDQAKLVGGIGPCGLPLCCATFLKSFDGISITMAKNQLLSINIPKLSGQCGKLLCCLKYEDEAYIKLRPEYPKIGEKFDYNNKSYEVTGLNLLTDTITTYNGDNYESFSKEEFERVKSGLTKTDENKTTNKDLNSNVDLSGHGVKDTMNRISQIERNEKRRKDEITEKINRNTNNNNKKQFNNKQNNKNRQSNNKNNNSHYQNRKNNNYHNNVKKESGFIPVSQITDKSILDFKPVKKDDKK